MRIEKWQNDKKLKLLLKASALKDFSSFFSIFQASSFPPFFLLAREKTRERERINLPTFIGRYFQGFLPVNLRQCAGKDCFIKSDVFHN